MKKFAKQTLIFIGVMALVTLLSSIYIIKAF